MLLRIVATSFFGVAVMGFGRTDWWKQKGPDPRDLDLKGLNLKEGLPSSPTMTLNEIRAQLDFLAGLRGGDAKKFTPGQNRRRFFTGMKGGVNRLEGAGKEPIARGLGDAKKFTPGQIRRRFAGMNGETVIVGKDGKPTSTKDWAHMKKSAESTGKKIKGGNW